MRNDYGNLRYALLGNEPQRCILMHAARSPGCWLVRTMSLPRLPQCRRCAAVRDAVLVEVAMLLFSVLLTLYTTWATFTDDYTSAATEGADGLSDTDAGAHAVGDHHDRAEGASKRSRDVGAGEVLHALIRHVQHFVIVTRLSIKWVSF